MIQAIVYTSNTGYTAQYAEMLGEILGLPMYTLEDSKALADRTEIIYLGWLMASRVMGLKEAERRFDIKVVAATCLGTTGSQIGEVRRINKIPADLPLFTLQGGFDMKRLRGMYKFMMRIVGTAIKKKIMSQPEQTEDDRRIVEMLDNGGSAVDQKHLKDIIQCIHSLH